MHLVIVESPTKARTISHYLGKDYVVESSIGHVRDLPQSAKEIPAKLKKESWARLGVDVTKDFQPLYIIPAKKASQVQKLKRLLKNADSLYLATDEDREGESISWHLQEVLKPKVAVRRLVFHEITKDAIEQALKNPRDIDHRLVRSQETRRVLDRLYGYEISPLLWRVIGSARSAGRVQSVAVRLTVTRERERMRFCPALWCDIQAELVAKQPEASDTLGTGAFSAVLNAVGEQRLATSKDFSDADGQPSSPALLWLKQPQATALVESLKEAQWQVEEVQEKPFSSKPQPPFTTSTLQQQANGRLHFSPRKTMQLAQRLYEQGYITYMRTDSTILSKQAQNATTSQIKTLFGSQYLPATARIYTSKVKNAQEAHEAIRPAGNKFKLPEQLKALLSVDELSLYQLVWRRTLASQMKDSQGLRTSVRLKALAKNTEAAFFQASGQVISFLGWLKVMSETPLESSGLSAESGLKDKNEKILPPLKKGDTLTATNTQMREHTTLPPPRFNEASLIKELEQQGIGRPSTYASIIDTILSRGYAFKKSNAIFPSFTAFALVQLLERHFMPLVDLDFTARMEDTLDAISRGEAESLPYLESFYHGNTRLDSAAKNPSAPAGLKQMLETDIDPRAVCSLSLPQGNKDEDVVVHVGRWGPYLEDSTGKRVSLPAETVPDQLTPEIARNLLQQQSSEGVLGTDHASGKTVFLKNGRYGPYVQLGDSTDNPKIKSLLPQQVPSELTLNNALLLLTLPHEIGISKADEPILVDFGRYGAYLRCGKETRSLPIEKLFKCTLAEAEALLAQPKASRAWQATAIRSLGKDPDGNEIKIYSGRYGPYVTNGNLNSSIPKGKLPEDLVLAEALKLLQDRLTRAPAKKKPPTRRKASPKRSTTKKSDAKKSG